MISEAADPRRGKPEWGRGALSALLNTRVFSVQTACCFYRMMPYVISSKRPFIIRYIIKYYKESIILAIK